MKTEARTSMPILRAALAALAALLVAVLAGACGGASQSEEPAARDDSRVDESIREMLPETVLEKGVLSVASDVPYPPYEMFDTDGESIVGVDPELASALGAVLGIEFRFEVVSFDSMIPSLTSGKYDIAMSGMADTAKRQEQVTFVDYMTQGGAFVVLAGSDVEADSMEALCGLTVGAQSATTMAEVLSAESSKCPKQAPLDLSLFAGQDDAINALRSGRIDVVVITTGSAGYLVEQTEGEFEISLTVPGGVLGIVVPKEQQQLAEAIQAALQKLIDEGTYTEVLDRYGLAEHNSVEKATINAGL